MRKLVEDFFRYYLTERSLENTLAFVTDEIISIGTGEHEIAKNKAELKALLESEFEEIPNAFDYKISSYTEAKVSETVCQVFANLQVRMEQTTTVIEMCPRFTCTLVKLGDEWKISCLHMSTPTAEQEENMFFPLRYGTNVVGQMSVDSSKKLMGLMAEAIPGGIMGGYLEEGFPLYTINDKMLAILGYTYEELIATTGEKMINMIHEGDRKRVEQEIEQQFSADNEYDIDYRAIGKDGRIIWVKDIGKKIVAEDGREAMISIMTDITERIEREKKLINEAEHDSLTNLYNRKKARSLLNAEFAVREKGTLFICDIDNFKHINDTRGHAAGDDVLKQLASIIQKHVSASCVKARLGGDEYIVFFPEYIETETAVSIMRDIQTEFAEFMRMTAPELEISLSVGGAVRGNREELRVLYKNADSALYDAKKKKNDLKLYAGMSSES